MKKIILFLLGILFVHTCYGQNSIKQASPSANFSSTLSSGVDLYTGKINVGFDLVDLKFAGEDLSLRIKYLAGNGVKVDELPSWVGLGWGLDAPGYVYRKVKGKPDELQTYKSTLTTNSLSFGAPFWASAITDKTLVTELHAQNKSFVNNRALLGGGSWNTPSTILPYKPVGGIPYMPSAPWVDKGGVYARTSVINTNSTPVIDLVPDEFSVQIGELSGAFFLNAAGEWTFISNNQLSCKVEVSIDYNYSTSSLRTPGVITKIVLTSSRGIRYTFDGDFESSNVSTTIEPNSSGPTVPGGNYFYDLTPTLWNISKIENLNTQEQVIYSYKPSFYQISKYHSAYGNSSGIFYDNHTTMGVDGSDWNYYTANYKVAHRTKLLEAITCSNGYKIEFNSSLSDQLLSSQSFLGSGDFSTDPILALKTFKHDLYKLNSISVFNESTLVNKVVFKYNEKPTERLQLERVEFTDGTAVSNFVSFSYNNAKLPDYGSRKTDHWGYYNGKDFFSTYPSGPYSESSLESYSGTFKSADTSLTDAEILEGFTLATGAKTTFEYEPNQYYTQIDDVSRQPVAVVGSTYGGGVRIKKVKIEQYNQQLSSTNYYYIKEDQSSSGILAQTPPSYISKIGSLNPIVYNFRQAGFSKNITNSNIVTYSRVVQKQQDTLTTITDFTNFDNGFADLPSQVKNFSGSVSTGIKDAYSDFSFKRGKIKSVKKMLQGQILPLEEVIYKYQHDFSEAAYPEYRAIHMSNFLNDFYYSAISYKRYPDLLVDIKTISNDKLGTIERSKTFAYDNFNNLIEETMTTSNVNGILKTAYKYPYHFTSSVYQDMVAKDKNLLTPIVETIVSKDNVQISLRRNNFGRFNANNILLPKSIEVQFGSHPVITKHLFNRYNAIGGLLEDQVPNGPKSTYLWGYKNQYMVATVVGSDSASVMPLVDQSILNNPSSDYQLILAISALRSSLPNSHITSYTYKPLVGMTSQTDVKGMTTYYSYDTFNRLENIANQYADIMKSYSYGYADGTSGPPVAPSYKSAAVTVYRTKDNCTTGTGSEVGYTIPALKYTSTVSQAAADQQAQADAEAGAQANANSLGTCGTAPAGTVSLNYSLPSAVQFKLRITNTATNAYTDHTISSSGVLNNITSGTVNLALSEVTASSTIYGFSLNGDTKSGNTASYNNFAFTADASLTITTAPSGGPHYNTAQTISKTKNNCPSGTGTAVSYMVAANSYSSPTSVTDANLLALAGEDARAQANANALGGCTVSGTTTYYSQITLITKSKNNCPNGVSGVPQTISYPLGAFSSLISVADADQQLHNAAQSSVNSNGGCAITSGIFSLNFVAPLSSHFSVHFKDAAGNTLRNLTIHGNHVINDLPGGTGSITIAPWPSPPAGLTFSYSVNGGTAQPIAPAQFNGIALSGTVNVNVVQTRFANQVLTVAKTRNNCPSGEIGAAVNYIVPESTYWSTVSQAAANQLAQADANANAQNYANQNAACTIATSPLSVYYTYGAKVLIEVTHLTRNTTVSHTSSGADAGTVLYVPNGLSKVKVTSLQVGKVYSVALPGQVQTGAVVEYASFDFPGYTINMNIREIFSNAALNVSKTKENCYGGQVGSTVTYTVPAGKYTSMLSQAQVDQWAQNEADANAQDYANTNGTCLTVYYSSVLPISKTKNDCPSGQVGSAVNYYVYGGKYTSTISQADADQKAVIGEDANAQAYANAHGTCTAPPTYYNAYLSVTKTRSNCTTAGYTGSSVTYTVPASTYSSLISQADANQKAQADADANAQNYANTNGTCTPPVTYYNSAISLAKTRNNCTVGQTGSSVTYAVPYAKHSSIISQADANQKAQDDITANAQNYANANGTCTTTVTYYNNQISVLKTRNNCTNGYVGSSITYSVPSARYSSTISQADANQKAQADVDANAQNYANASAGCELPTYYYNTELNVSATKSCPSGQTGSVVIYNVPYGRYLSTTSQADADQLAQADADSNAQTNANAQGSCTTPTFTLHYSTPSSAQFKLYVTDFATNIEYVYNISGNGSITNIPPGISGGIYVTAVPAVTGVYYRFSLSSSTYVGVNNYYNVNPVPLNGDLTLTITNL